MGASTGKHGFGGGGWVHDYTKFRCSMTFDLVRDDAKIYFIVSVKNDNPCLVFLLFRTHDASLDVSWS